MTKQLPGASSYTDRHGRKRWRFRRKGARGSVELGTDYGSPDFVRRYDAAVRGEHSSEGAGAGRTVPKSVSALISHYYQSREYAALAASSRTTYRGILERFRELHGDKRVSHIEYRHIEAMMRERIETPQAANNLLDRLKVLLDMSVRLGWRKDNPARLVRAYPSKTGGHYTWTDEDIERFLRAHPPGTLAHTAMTLMLYTGAARSDAVRLGQGNVRNGRIQYRRQKTAGTGGDLIDIPIHPKLREVIDACRPDAFTFLETAHRKSRSPNGLGNLMREWCDAAGLPECSSHGLRKAIARRLAEAGATTHEIAAITGHKTLKEIERYTNAADRSRLAAGAI